MKRAGGHYESKVVIAKKGSRGLVSVFGGYEMEKASCTLGFMAHSKKKTIYPEKNKYHAAMSVEVLNTL